MQSNFKFDQQNMVLKKDKASTSRGSNHILKQILQEGRLLAYINLCPPILEYADTVWDPTLAKEIQYLKILKEDASRSCALNLVYSLSDRDAEITDYLFL